MKHRAFFVLLPLVGLLLAACAGSPTTLAEPIDGAAPTSAPAATEPSTQADMADIQVDEQGAVKVSVTPINLNTPGATLDFEVVLDTHSVDLSMDLTTLAILTTDNGPAVSPGGWDGPLGGHHVGGTLSFPAEVGGVAVLDGASRLTLVIRDLDAPERVFAWDLPPFN